MRGQVAYVNRTGRPVGHNSVPHRPLAIPTVYQIRDQIAHGARTWPEPGPISGPDYAPKADFGCLRAPRAHERARRTRRCQAV